MFQVDLTIINFVIIVVASLIPLGITVAILRKDFTNSLNRLLGGAFFLLAMALLILAMGLIAIFPDDVSLFLGRVGYVGIYLAVAFVMAAALLMRYGPQVWTKPLLVILCSMHLTKY